MPNLLSCSTQGMSQNRPQSTQAPHRTALHCTTIVPQSNQYLEPTQCYEPRWKHVHGSRVKGQGNDKKKSEGRAGPVWRCNAMPSSPVRNTREAHVVQYSSSFNGKHLDLDGEQMTALPWPVMARPCKPQPNPMHFSKRLPAHSNH